MRQRDGSLWQDRKRTLFGLPWSFTRYYLTEKKLITSVGFFSISEDEIDLYRITDKRLHLSFLQRIFGVGSIIVLSKDVDSPIKTIKSVKKPREVMELLDKHIQSQRNHYRVQGRDMIGTVHEHAEYEID